MKDPLSLPSHIFTKLSTGQYRKINKDSLYALIGGETILKLLLHIPNYFLSRELLERMGQENVTNYVAIRIRPYKYVKAFRKGLPHRVKAMVGGQNLDIVFFNFPIPLLQKMLPPDEDRIISGKLGFYKSGYQITNPDYMIRVHEYHKIKNEAIYPLTAGITNQELNKLVHHNLKNLAEIEDWHDETLKEQNGFLGFVESLRKMHLPENDEEIDKRPEYLARLAYDECLASQLSVGLMRLNNKNVTGASSMPESSLYQEYNKHLPFELTPCQLKSIDEVISDMASLKRMTRMLQGDVGSGKTMVAIAAMIYSAGCGSQSALMAPTSILAEQHFRTFTALCKDLPVKIELLKGDMGVHNKKILQSKLKKGEVDIVIGTHALFYDKVEFKNLGLVVIDEQHRFGVQQRSRLAEKGYNTDMLLMSATPIPRSLALSLYGDMDLSFLKSKPKGRKEIITRVMSDKKAPDILLSAKSAIEKGDKIYWICPLVEEQEKSDLKAVETRYKEFQQYFGTDKVAMIHGQMDSSTKENAFAKFKEGDAKILVATTVIEVGVDVPDSTIIVIEQAERFGLAQLHQLRGRVGRSELQSKCVLLYTSYKVNEVSLARLDVMRSSNDGFYIAEQDLKIRGAGDLVGIKQSGLPNFQFVNLREHYDLLKIANKDAKCIIAKDPYLASNRGRRLQLLLKIFDYDLAAIIKNIS
ncbi:MAG: ATP-dependent DNA helicase RecG [Rickettsiales bacterium]|jgi:ATP-dependent DNA helicase RecG|nr:ATP-dependent DNA helicase RecG [Rickettsiales bacterium]